MKVAFDFDAWRAAHLLRTEAAIDEVLPPAELLPTALHAAMRHGAEGGKRVRALLVHACGEAYGVTDPVRLDVCSVAVELTHAFSLIHDDLPCMDDDALRRGKPTVHRVWNEATAVLAGDALQALAMEQLVAAQAIPPQARLACAHVLARATGSRGMCGGQQMDLDAERHAIDLAELEALHIHKTGELILACARMARACSNAADLAADDDVVEHAVKCLGLAFQIQDDLLDNDADTETLGKTSGKDRVAGKATFPGLLGVNAARERCQALFLEARESLPTTADHAALQALVAHVEQRRA